MYRATGVGLVGSVGRLAAGISPYLIYEIFLNSPYFPFFIYTILFIVSLFTMLTYPKDFTGSEMEF